MGTIDTGATPHHSGGSSPEQFMARLTKYLEDGKEAGKHRQLDRFADDVKNFISTEYFSKPLGGGRNDIIVLVAQHLPGLTQGQIAYVVGTSVATVNRVLNGDDTGGGNRGWGGARK